MLSLNSDRNNIDAQVATSAEPLKKMAELIQVGSSMLGTKARKLKCEPVWPPVEQAAMGIN